MTDLSPAAQAVLTAVTQQEYCLNPSDIPNEAGRVGRLVAAALRAAADHVVLEEDPWAHYKLGIVWRKLLDIADELEGYDTVS